MPQLQSIDEVVEVPEALEEAVSVPVDALTSETRWEMAKEQQIYVNIEMRQLMLRECLQTVVNTIGREGNRQYRAC